jgi:hypothetical protein
MIRKFTILFLIFTANISHSSPLFDMFDTGDINLSSNNNSNRLAKFEFLASNNDQDQAFDENHHHSDQIINNEDEESHNNNNDDQDSELGDDSVFGNTGESFFEFANRRVNEIKNQNKLQFEKSINSCVYSPKAQLTKRYVSESETFSGNESNRISINTNKRCILGSFKLSDVLGKTSDRLFMHDPITLGLISSADSTLRLFNFNMVTRTLHHLRTKHFHNEVPVDACSDKFKNIYVVFPDQNKIAKYQVYQTYINQKSSLHSKSNKTRIGMKEIISIKDSEFFPSAIACHDDLIYVSERPKNQIRVYDKQLRVLRLIYLNGVIVSSHHALAVNQNVRVTLDGLDAISLFNPNNMVPNEKFDIKKKYSLIPENNRVNMCHFYKKISCLNDLHVLAESKSKSYIYLIDSCDANLLEFVYNKDEKINMTRRIHIPLGMPISVTANQFGNLFVLTDSPRKIFMIDMKECN